MGIKRRISDGDHSNKAEPGPAAGGIKGLRWSTKKVPDSAADFCPRPRLSTAVVSNRNTPLPIFRLMILSLIVNLLISADVSTPSSSAVNI